MATINSTSDTNDINLVLTGHTGRRIQQHTDRNAGANSRGALLSRLGSGIIRQEATLTNPFTTATS